MITYCTTQDVARFLTQRGFSGDTMPLSATVQLEIDLAASELNMSLKASNQFTCVKDDDVTGYLRLINVVGAVLLLEYDNVRHLTETDLARYADWKTAQLELIRTGKIALCAGETGSDYPCISTAEVAYTDEAMAKIFINYYQRSL